MLRPRTVGGWARVGAVAIVGPLGACGPAPPSIPPASPPSGAPTVEVEPPAPEPPPAPGPSVEDAKSAAALVRRLCEAASDGDSRFITEHVELPILGHAIVGEDPSPQLGGGFSFGGAASLPHWAICEHPLAADAALDDFSLDGSRAIGFATLDGHRYRLTFERDPPRLIEQSYVLPEASLPPRAPTDREIVVNADPRSDYGPLDDLLARRFQGYLLTHPNCIEAQAQREPIGVSMLVTVATAPGKAPEVRLYASTMASVEYLACLQTQLTPTLSEIVRDEPGPALHRIWGMIGITVFDHEIDEDVPTLEMGP
ncbi:MAG: hypothetical protein R3B72_31195 [Polyangiaceae bacterium]